MELKKKLARLKMVVFDFDGVFTNGKVSVDENGIESVICSRKDGFGIVLLRRAGLKIFVISSESNPVVRQRCNKMNIDSFTGICDKLPVFKKLLEENSVAIEDAAFMGDDLNDLDCLKYTGVAFSVADGNLKCKEVADYVTKRNGGDHAVREVCDLILQSRA